MAQEFLFTFKIDCEATQPAINDAALGERALKGFTHVLEREGLRGTFYCIPTELKAHRDIYRDLETRGHEIGLHLHAKDQGYEEFLGIYGPDMQEKIVREAADVFAQTMGRRPVAFSSGYGSGNDHTYPVLEKLGFRHGGVGIPTRVLPECCSVWAGMPLGCFYPQRYSPVDLRKVANERLHDDKACDGKGFIDAGPQRDLRALKPGRRYLAGTLFDIIDATANKGRNCVMVHNRGRFNGRLPSFVEIPVGHTARALSFLHALDHTPGWCYSRRPKLAGYYEMVFADGTFDTLALMYNDNIANWDRYREYRDTAPASRHLGQARIGWMGWMASGEPATLYIADWINPRPDQVIAKVRFHATEKMQAMSPFLVAMTATLSPQGAAPAATDAGLSPVYADHFTLTEPRGVEIPLHPGRDVTRERYVTDTGIEVTAGGHDGIERDRIKVGQSVARGSWTGDLAFPGDLATYVHGRRGFVMVRLPRPQGLAGLQMRGKCMIARGSGVRSDYSPASHVVVEVSPDGKTFSRAREIARYVPERDVPIWVDLGAAETRALRIEFGAANKDDRRDWHPGVSSLRLFRAIE